MIARSPRRGDLGGSDDAREGSTIVGFGHYVPERCVTNHEIEARLGLESGWIERRTGIVERRYAADTEALSDLARAAAEMALRASGIDRARVGLLLLATSTPDQPLPPTAPLVAHQLGLTGGAVDLAGACSGFVYALGMADAFAVRHRRPVLVVAANILSRRLNERDPATASLFGDGAGAVVVAPSRRLGSRAGVLGIDLASDGSAYGLIGIEAGGSCEPFSPTMDVAATQMRITDGRAVFSRAVHMMTASSQAALSQAEVSASLIDYWIPHQANARIVSATRQKLGVSEAKTVTSVARYGNSSAATIPLSWSLLAERQSLPEGACFLLSAAGAGMTGGAMVYRL
ncbi:MAG: beta-ketoacyl-ACP synthase III [Deltaproteobacteria bacterium]|nr:beta-ketoacyl-ACP synthase III [Deltaproteobacteria bacterium]